MFHLQPIPNVCVGEGMAGCMGYVDICLCRYDALVYIVATHTCSHHHHIVQVAICMPIHLCAELVNALVAFLQVEHNQCKLQ